MRIVLDTNVLVSGLISAAGPPGRIVDLLRAGAVQTVVDDRILAEYRDVLSRQELRRWISVASAEVTIDFLVHASYRVDCSAVVVGLPDPGDTPFLEAALTAGVPLVTGNARHFPLPRRGGAEVLSPRDFVARVADSAGNRRPDS